jgi:branched-chain amino acid transport system ATP-binding protein
MLEVSGIRVFRGEAQVLWDVSMGVHQGEVVTVLGANGAGKTTLFETILGLHHPRGGTIRFKDRDITQEPPFRITRMGVACVPEGRRIFKDMTVYENLEMGAYPPGARPRLRETMAWVFELFPVLEERQRQISGTMSGGQQQMLAIGRALMSRPSLLLLDELSLGLAPVVTTEIYGVLRRLNEQGVTMLLIEQNATRTLRNSHRAYVLETGRIVLQGRSQELMEDEHVKRAYLGA